MGIEGGGVGASVEEVGEEAVVAGAGCGCGGGVWVGWMSGGKREGGGVGWAKVPTEAINTHYRY